MSARRFSGRALAILVSLGLLVACSDSDVRSTWTSAAGETVQAFSGSRHCDWNSITFIDLPKGRFAADPDRLVPPQWREADYAEGVELPSDAVASGFTSGEQAIWYAADGTHVFIGSANSVDVWPKIVRGFGCD